MTLSGRGALIVVEGLDRAGKSTQCGLLCQNLETSGRQVKRMRFPNRSTTIGQSIDAYLKGESTQDDHVIHLLFSANRWEAAAQMKADIDAGVTIVVDRYYYSGIVYSAAKDKVDLTLQWAREPDVGLPRPDVCIFLDLAPEVTEERGGFGVERYETSKMQGRVRELFYELLKRPDGEDMVVIDAGRPSADVKQDMWRTVDDIFHTQKMQQPLGKILPWA